MLICELDLQFGSDQSFWLRTEYERTMVYDSSGNLVSQYNTIYAF
jgi:hypothetical protein